MTTQTEAERLADGLEKWNYPTSNEGRAAAELRRLVSFNQQLMDEVARLNKAVADEREACAELCHWVVAEPGADVGTALMCVEKIRARRNT